MLEVEEQLARLRQRMAAIDGKYTKTKPIVKPAGERASSCGKSIKEWAEGRVVGNEFGEHFQTERLFPAHKQHGSADIGALAEMPAALLDTLSGNEIQAAEPGRWAFLDTETTGLAGGSGTYAFLIGVGRITPAGFAVRQYFMREYVEERSILLALEEHLAEFDVLITYNGRSYDQPLLETRFLMNRHKPPFGRLGHLDLLYGARRLWKLRLDSCRLTQLEQEILGVYREGDLAGELIPYVYFEYLRTKEAQRLIPVFHHNAIDILTLACLTAIVPAAFRNTDCDSLSRVGVRLGPELAGIARWLKAAGECEQALELLKRAVDAGLPDGLLFRSLWDIACLQKKLGRPFEALPIFIELSGCRNEHRAPALEELAKYYEHEECNYALALDFTEQALGFHDSGELRHRRERLARRLAKPCSRKLI
ncbi:MAG: ribonuclease H-like domain-containing protein [Acidobacteriota bacterium]|nr:ribonuclease H-like domain-containing protein [Acidobacteriota bacterium]